MTGLKLLATQASERYTDVIYTILTGKNVWLIGYVASENSHSERTQLVSVEMFKCSLHNDLKEYHTSGRGARPDCHL